MKAIIIAGGTPPSIELIKEELLEPSIIICADSGANCLFQYNLTCDYLIGDFDSIKPEAMEYHYKSKCIIERYPVEKDDTDTQLALLKAIELNVTNIAFLGCTGSRLDHTFGNIGLLLECLKYQVKAYIRDNKNTIWLTDKPAYINGRKDDYFSLLAYGTDVNGLTIQGAKYNLTNYNLRLGSSLTLSNEFAETIVKIDFNNGMLLIIKSFD